jgi:hypothetical protein
VLANRLSERPVGSAAENLESFVVHSSLKGVIVKR